MKNYKYGNDITLSFIDWKQVFDKIPHDKLIEKIEELPLSEKVKRTVKIILKNGRISVNNEDIINLEIGTP
jgi:retron-type reverse transcriptase